jgi:hypothetical protein
MLRRQCCQVAEIPAKKLKRGLGKKVGRKNLWPNFAKSCRKGAEENLLKKFLTLLSETKAKFNFNFPLTLWLKAALMFL